MLAVILELNAQNSVTIHGYHTATDFFRLQLPRDLVIRHPHLVEIPGVTQSALSFLKLSRIFWPEPVAPLPNGFIRDGNATFGQKVFNIPQAQAKTIVQPNCMTDDGRRKSVSMVELLGIFHAHSLTDLGET